MRPHIAIQQPLIDETDDLFTLTAQTCTDCGQPFESSRRSPRCALCASLRSGQVGAATVVCVACELEHQIPILAPTKLCGPCRLDPAITASSLRARLAAADAAYADTVARLDADLAHATATDVARYRAALSQEAAWGPERFGRNVQAAITRGDGLAPLLVALIASRQAHDAAGRIAEEVWRGLNELDRLERLER